MTLHEPCGFLYTALASQQLNQAEQSLAQFHCVEQQVLVTLPNHVVAGGGVLARSSNHESDFPAHRVSSVCRVVNSSNMEAAMCGNSKHVEDRDEGPHCYTPSSFIKLFVLRRNSRVFSCPISAVVAERQIARFKQASFRAPCRKLGASQAFCSLRMVIAPGVFNRG